MDHEFYMQHALNLAAKGWPLVTPNPMVGCVIVCDQQIAAEGYHEIYGGPHAEVNALKNLSAEADPSKCTLYVTLEPCSHFGKTPPCADLIIKTGIKKVVICNNDPNPLVAGKGKEKLLAAGIEVITGILEDQGNILNKRFFTFHKKKRPYIILKWTQTADGFISRLPVPKDRKDNIIGTPQQQQLVHQMRAEETAIMVGKNTVLHDNPHLTTRFAEGKNPIRIFIDRKLEVPETFNIFSDEAVTLVFNGKTEQIKENIRYILIDFSGNVLQQIVSKLYSLNIQSVIVEGGLTTLTNFLKEKLFDEIKVFENKDLKFGEGIKAPILP
ncbi:MAG: Riboflavin biosynthesis protein RibD [Bacteroidetes bacterium]|nr:Riboflavin biosynthesis protein RibD [Bacteroidota bacterium]